MGYPQRDRRKEIRDARASLPCSRQPPEPVPRASHAVRETITSVGFDDFRQLNPDGFMSPGRTGIRIPPVPTSQLASPYLVVLAVADLLPGDRLCAVRLGMEIGQYVNTTDFPLPPGSIIPPPPIYFEVRSVVTYNWRFQDGGQTFVLTREPLKPRVQTSGPFDMDTFRFRDGRSAMVYASAGFPLAPALPGYLGLNAYSAPAMRGRAVWTSRDLVYPWDKALSEDDLWLDVEIPTRFRLYCHVQQTNPLPPGGRTTTTFAPPASFPLYATGAVPEENFLQVFSLAVYWAAFGRLIVERRTPQA
jgi:hypothetical protein